MADTNGPLLSSIEQLRMAVERLADHQMNALQTSITALSEKVDPQRQQRQAVSDHQVGMSRIYPSAGAVSTDPSRGSSIPPTPPQAAQVAPTARAQLNDQARTQQDQTPGATASPTATAQVNYSNDRSTPPGAAPTQPADSSTPPRRQEHDPRADTENALTWAMIGQQGGPLGRVAVDRWALQRNLGFAQGGLGSLGGALKERNPDGGALQSLIGTSPKLDEQGNLQRDEEGNPVDPGSGLNRMIGTAQRSTGAQLGMIAGLRAYRTGRETFANAQQAGLDLGYGGQDSGGLGLFGARRPLAQWGATQEGLGLAAETQALQGRIPGMGFGAGMTSQQSQEAVSGLRDQGWSNQGGMRNWASGDNAQIAQNVMRPGAAMGMSTEDMLQWTNSLRNSKASTDELRASMQEIPEAAQAARENIHQYNAAVIASGDAAAQMGGTQMGGRQNAMTFSRTTGMDPAIGTGLSRNNYVQGQAMAQYGVMPWEMGALPSGAQQQLERSAMQQMSTAIPNMPAVRDKQGNLLMSSQARRGAFMNMLFPEAGGAQNVEAFMAQGGSGGQGTAQTQLSNILGNRGGGIGDPGTGIRAQYLGGGQGTAAQQQQALQALHQQMSPQMLKQALQYDPNAQRDMQAIQGAKTFDQADQMIRNAMGNATRNNNVNTLKGTRAYQNSALGGTQQLGNALAPINAQGALQVQFTGLANKIFQQSGPGTLRLGNNAGGTPTNVTSNSVLGDLFHMPGGSGGLPSAPGPMPSSAGSTGTGSVF